MRTTRKTAPRADRPRTSTSTFTCEACSAEARSGCSCEQQVDAKCRYLQQKHGNFQNVICEVAYNLMDGLKRCALLVAPLPALLFMAVRRYKADADIEMLGLILAGELREEVYTQQLHMMDLVFAACERAELDSLPAGAPPTGVLPWAKFEKTVRSVLPLKADDLFEEIMKAAREKQPNGNAVEMKGEVEYIKYVCSRVHCQTKN
jgi:hypothetical protein